jgi:hypothetical protein
MYSKIMLFMDYVYDLARVVELVDTRDLKSLDSNIVPVQVRPRVPLWNNFNKTIITTNSTRIR